MFLVTAATVNVDGALLRAGHAVRRLVREGRQAELPEGAEPASQLARSSTRGEPSRV